MKEDVKVNKHIKICLSFKMQTKTTVSNSKTQTTMTKMKRLVSPNVRKQPQLLVGVGKMI